MQRKAILFGWAASLVVAMLMPTNVLALDVLFIGDLDEDGGGDGNVPAYTAADAIMINHLGYFHTVDTHDDAGVTFAVTSAKDYDFIVVSSTCSSGTYASDNSGDGRHGAQNSLLTDATIVLMEGGNAVMSAFAINPAANATLGTQTGTAITIMADDGYVTAGLPLGSLTIYNSASAIGTWGSTPGTGQFLDPWTGGPGTGQAWDFSGTPLADVVDGVFGGVGVRDVTTGTKAIADNDIVCLPFHNGAFPMSNANGLKLFDNTFYIPEPTTGVLLAIGAVGLLTRRSRNRVV